MNNERQDINDERQADLETLAELPVIDPSVMGELVELGGPALVAKMVAQFVEDATVCVDQVVSAVGAGDASGVVEAAHGLKGICRNMGAEKLAYIAELLEQKGKANTLVNTEAISETLREEFEQVTTALREQT